MAALEALEDRYAPIGFFGEPIMKGLRYQNIVFVRPELPRLYPRASMLSSHFAIPGLEKIPASELRGPVKVFRFGHPPSAVLSLLRKSAPEGGATPASAAAEDGPRRTGRH